MSVCKPPLLPLNCATKFLLSPVITLPADRVSPRTHVAFMKINLISGLHVSTIHSQSCHISWPIDKKGKICGSVFPSHGHRWSHNFPSAVCFYSLCLTAFKLAIRTEMGFLDMYPLLWPNICNTFSTITRNCLNLACLGLLLPFWFPIEARRPRLFVLLPLLPTSPVPYPVLYFSPASAGRNGWLVSRHASRSMHVAPKSDKSVRRCLIMKVLWCRIKIWYLLVNNAMHMLFKCFEVRAISCSLARKSKRPECGTAELVLVDE